METFTQILGWLTILVCSIAIGGVAVVGAANAIHRLWAWMYEKAYNKAVHNIANHLRASAHWFGEDYNTAKCLSILADRMSKDMADYAYPEKWRDEWRDACSKFKSTGIAP